MTRRKTADAKKSDRNDTGSRGKVVPINPEVKNSNIKLQSHYIGNETNYYTINNQYAESQMKLQNPTMTIKSKFVHFEHRQNYMEHNCRKVLNETNVS